MTHVCDSLPCSFFISFVLYGEGLFSVYACFARRWSLSVLFLCVFLLTVCLYAFLSIFLPTCILVLSSDGVRPVSSPLIYAFCLDIHFASLPVRFGRFVVLFHFLVCLVWFLVAPSLVCSPTSLSLNISAVSFWRRLNLGCCCFFLLTLFVRLLLVVFVFSFWGCVSWSIIRFCFFAPCVDSILLRVLCLFGCFRLPCFCCLGLVSCVWWCVLLLLFRYLYSVDVS